MFAINDLRRLATNVHQTKPPTLRARRARQTFSPTLPHPIERVSLPHHIHPQCAVYCWIFSIFTSVQFTFSSLVFKRILISDFPFYFVSRLLCATIYVATFKCYEFHSLRVFSRLAFQATSVESARRCRKVQTSVCGDPLPPVIVFLFSFCCINFSHNL